MPGPPTITDFDRKEIIVRNKTFVHTDHLITVSLSLNHQRSVNHQGSGVAVWLLTWPRQGADAAGGPPAIPEYSRTPSRWPVSHFSDRCLNHELAYSTCVS